jgi:hypothetical protein
MYSLADLQTGFANHLRDPATYPAPGAIEERRLAIYRELIFNNTEGFISSGFPVLRSLYTAADWNQLVRNFIREHRCETPYFLNISQEFLHWLDRGRQPHASDPAFLRELAHYEWVELALAIAMEDVPDTPPLADLLQGRPRLSPLVWVLAYQYPVHRIGRDYQPVEAPAGGTYLVVYRNRALNVEFMEINAVTARLLALLEDDTITSGRAALLQLAQDMAHPQPESLLSFGADLLRQLQDRSILF